jgi:hypothetical protein
MHPPRRKETASMRSLRKAVPLALAAGLIAAAPAAADAKAPPRAHASGGDVVTLTYPSLVRVRVARTERALDRAERKTEHGKFDEAATSLKVVRRQMAAAWRGAKYVIRTTPPPPATEDVFRPRARKSGGAPAGPTFASPPETAMRVLELQHDVSASVVQLIDGAHGAGLNALATTLNFTNDRRDGAMNYIVSIAPPAPPEAEDAGAHARASQEEDAAPPSFDTLMPNLIPQFDDELQGIAGLTSDATDLTAGGRRLLNAAEKQIQGSKAFVNLHWPPVPAED